MKQWSPRVRPTLERVAGCQEGGPVKRSLRERPRGHKRLRSWQWSAFVGTYWKESYLLHFPSLWGAEWKAAHIGVFRFRTERTNPPTEHPRQTSSAWVAAARECGGSGTGSWQVLHDFRKGWKQSQTFWWAGMMNVNTLQLKPNLCMCLSAL